jgi:hypothetical protein
LQGLIVCADSRAIESRLESRVESAGGGIGRRAGFRFQWGNLWGFESPPAHHFNSRGYTRDRDGAPDPRAGRSLLPILARRCIRRFPKNLIPPCLSFRPSSMLRQRLHKPTMRPLSRLEYEQSQRFAVPASLGHRSWASCPSRSLLRSSPSAIWYKIARQPP